METSLPKAAGGSAAAAGGTWQPGFRPSFERTDFTRAAKWMMARKFDSKELNDLRKSRNPEVALRGLLGHTFLRRFAVEKLLGADGFGLVIKCLDEQKNVWAIKVAPIFQCLGKSDRVLAKQELDELQREVTMLRKVHEDHDNGNTPHPRFVHLDSVFFNDEASALMMKMPLLKGGDLCDNLKKLNLKQKKSVAAQLVEGLLWLQTRNPPIVHRDIKPENIFVDIVDDSNVNVTIFDFGMARTLDCAGTAEAGASAAGATSAGESKTDNLKERQKTPKRGTPGYIAPEALRDDYGVEVDNFAVGKTLMALFFETTLLHQDSGEGRGNSVFSVEEAINYFNALLETPPRFTPSWAKEWEQKYGPKQANLWIREKASESLKRIIKSAKTAEQFIEIIDGLCHPERLERMTMGQAAEHDWLLSVGLSVPPPQSPAVAGPRTSDMIAPLRGASLTAVREFLSIPKKRETSLKTNLFGVMVRFDEFELGSDDLKRRRHKQECALLLYMYGEFADAKKKLEDVIHWCNEEPPKDNDLVEQLHVQSLSQMVSTLVQIGKKTGEPVIGRLVLLIGQLEILSSSRSGNRVNNQRVYLMAKFKLIEVRMGQAKSAAVGAAEAAEDAHEAEKEAKNEKAAQTQKASDEAKNHGAVQMQYIKDRLDDLLKEFGLDETKDKELREAIEMSALIVQNRLLDMQLKAETNLGKCEEIFDQFKCIYEKRQKLYGGHSDARLVIQSAKNCGESCVKLANFLRELRDQASVKKYNDYIDEATKFYKIALDGQRKYMGADNEYYKKILRKLNALELEGLAAGGAVSVAAGHNKHKRKRMET